MKPLASETCPSISKHHSTLSLFINSFDKIYYSLLPFSFFNNTTLKSNLIILNLLTMPSATLKSYKHLLLIVILIFPISLTVSKSGVGLSPSAYGERIEMEQRKKVLGSRPPACVNKCSSCRPCMATLVIPPHKIKSKTGTNNYENIKSYNSNEDDTYYLLSWKCKCGDKVFQP